MGYLLSTRKTPRIITRKLSPCKAKPITNELSSDSWSGRRSFVLCGGPSLGGFDFNLIRGECTIGVNKSFTRFNTDICYGMDQRFYDSVTFPNRQDPENVQLHNEWVRFSGLKVFPKVDEKIRLDPSVHFVKTIKKKCISLDVNQGIYTGGNSGFGGMMLAIALGSRKIFLLGADLKIDERKKRTHFHDGYPNQNVKNLIRALGEFKKEFEYFADSLVEYGIDVINLNPDSALECFPKKEIREVL